MPAEALWRERLPRSCVTADLFLARKPKKSLTKIGLKAAQGNPAFQEISAVVGAIPKMVRPFGGPISPSEKPMERQRWVRDRGHYKSHRNSNPFYCSCGAGSGRVKFIIL
jgi:hypothetical protein